MFRFGKANATQHRTRNQIKEIVHTDRHTTLDKMYIKLFKYSDKLSTCIYIYIIHTNAHSLRLFSYKYAVLSTNTTKIDNCRIQARHFHCDRQNDVEYVTLDHRDDTTRQAAFCTSTLRAVCQISIWGGGLNFYEKNVQSKAVTSHSWEKQQSSVTFLNVQNYNFAVNCRRCCHLAKKVFH